jgi:ectoine hydroxylase-related dioxygenase (phytanoyl-CoA dioxygenase family)
MARLPEPDKQAFERDGFVVVRGVLPAQDAVDFRHYVESLLAERSRARDGARQASARYGQDGRPSIIKITQLTETDPRFQDLASRDEIVDVIEDLLGPGARIFRDALIVKPAGSRGLFSYHQDAAYWDVDPPRFASCWLAVSDVPANGSCLRVIAGSHDRRRKHGLVVAGRALPSPVTAGLRRLVTYAGTGDNPGKAGGNKGLWRAKRFVLGRATRYVPALAGLQDYRAVPSEVDLSREVVVPLETGDAVFFHGLTLHGSGPNETEVDRMAPVISYMAADARFVGAGDEDFRPARRPASADGIA